jgi:hypothetical protein
MHKLRTIIAAHLRAYIRRRYKRALMRYCVNQWHIERLDSAYCVDQRFRVTHPKSKLPRALRLARSTQV